MIRKGMLLLALLSVACLTATIGLAADEIEIRGKALGPDSLPYPEARVTLYRTVSPFQHAELQSMNAEPEPAATGKTGAGGEFLLNAPGAGLWTVRIEAPGFVPLEYSLEPLVEPTVLKAATLETDTGLAVQVTGKEGQPVSGAQVRLAARTDRRARMFSATEWETPTPSGLTGDDGSVRLPRAAGDRRDLVVSAVGHALSRRPAGAGTGVAIRLKQATSRTILVTEEIGDNQVPVAEALILDKETGQPLGWTGEDGKAQVATGLAGKSSVRVFTADGRSTTGSRGKVVLPPLEAMVGQLIDSASLSPLAGGVVWPTGEPWNAVNTDRAGGFILQATLGDKLEILADATGYLRSNDYPYSFDGEGRPGPIIPLTPAASIEGTVVDTAGKGIPDAEVSLKVRQDHSGMMRIEIGGSPSPEAFTDDRGRFRISKVDTSDNYDLGATAEGYVKGKNGSARPGTWTHPVRRPCGDPQRVPGNRQGPGHRGRAAVRCAGPTGTILRPTHGRHDDHGR